MIQSVSSILGQEHTAYKMLSEGVNQLGLHLSDYQLQALLDYLDLMKKWNHTYNLTAVDEINTMIPLHLLDSLAVVPYLLENLDDNDGRNISDTMLSGSKKTMHLLDIGCGAGLPGIPLAITCPWLSVTLADANAKKTAFVQQAKIELRLDNVDVIRTRVEKWHPSMQFDLIISRAFSTLADMVNLTNHLLKSGGQWLAMKGRVIQDEVDQLSLVSADVHRVIPFIVPGVNGNRHLLVIERD